MRNEDTSNWWWHRWAYLSCVILRRTRQKEAPATEFLYVGTENGLESQIVPKAKIPFKTIKIQGFKRSLSPQNFKTIYLF